MIQVIDRQYYLPFNWSLSIASISPKARFFQGEIVILDFHATAIQAAVLKSLDSADYPVYSDIKNPDRGAGVVEIPFHVHRVEHVLRITAQGNVDNVDIVYEPSYELVADTGVWEDYFVWLFGIRTSAEWINDVVNDIEKYPFKYGIT